MKISPAVQKTFLKLAVGGGAGAVGFMAADYAIELNAPAIINA